MDLDLLLQEQYKITPAQLRVMKEVAKGKTNFEISHSISLSDKGVKYHLTNIFRIMGVKNRTALIVKLKELGDFDKPLQIQKPQALPKVEKGEEEGPAPILPTSTKKDF